jgi:hypothetical protein
MSRGYCCAPVAPILQAKSDGESGMSCVVMLKMVRGRGGGGLLYESSGRVGYV